MGLENGYEIMKQNNILMGKCKRK